MTYWRDHGGIDGRSFPVADRYFAGAVTLPLFPGMTASDIDTVCDVVRRVLG
jgi:dTDP-4-amino-4,6-dideoxygalactose transaminase